MGVPQVVFVDQGIVRRGKGPGVVRVRMLCNGKVVRYLVGSLLTGVD